MFVDRAVIDVVAGTGGSGSDAFRRESRMPRGGPSGGDGGRGGDVILEADPQLSTLLDYSYRRRYEAERGGHGEGSDRTGRDGKDIVLKVPLGTIVRDLTTGEFLGEMLKPSDRLIVAKGGRGGRGNARFATATNQAPTRWEPGWEGEVRQLELELRLIADVGLVGEPNAGKSTLLASVSDARPKIADYPFTTLTPNLGVVKLPVHSTFVMADIPGIIEGAHEGKGLGLQFLRHIERTRTLAFLVPLDSPDPAAEYARLRAEVASHSVALSRTPHCLVLTKADLLPRDEEPEVFAAPDAWGTFVISSVSRRGLTELIQALYAKTREIVEAERTPEEEEWWVP